MLSWQLYTAISVLGLSISIVLQRILLRGGRLNPYAYAAVFQAMVGILLTIAALAAGFNLAGVETVWLPALLSAVAYGIGHIVYAKTLQKVEASAFSVYFATHAIWMMLFGVLLFGEHLTWLQLVGVALIFLGILTIVTQPIKLLTDQGAAYGLLTGVLFGVAITAWAYVGRHVDTLSWAAVSFLLPVLVIFVIRPKTLVAVPRLLRDTSLIWKLFVLAVFYGIGSLAMLYAYKEGSLAVISPLRQTGIIATTLLALLFISAERHDIRRKLLAAVLCCAGVVAVVL